MGSATTLIVFKIFKTAIREITCVAPNDIKFNKDILYEDLVQFASAPLTLDSYGFSEQLKNTKWFDLDFETFSTLQANTGVDTKGKKLDLREYWAWLNA